MGATALGQSSTMDTFYKSYVRDRLIVTRWVQPTPEGIRELSRLVRKQHEQREDKLFLASVIGPECPVPNNESRKTMAEEHDQLREILLSSRMVLLGQSIRQAMMRSVLAGLGMLLGRRVHYEIDTSANALFEAIEDKLALQRKQISRQLVEAEVLLPEEVET